MSNCDDLFLKNNIKSFWKNFRHPKGFNKTTSGRYIAVQGYCIEAEEPKLEGGFCRLLDDIIQSPRCDEKLKNLNGSYAAIVICPSECEIHLISDRWGTRPLFYTLLNEEIIIGSSFWQVVDCMKSPKLSMVASVEMMTFDYVLGQHTMIEDVFELTRASHAVIKVNGNGNANINRLEPLWCYDIRPEEKNPKDVIYDIAHILKQVGKRHSDVLKHMQIEKIGLNLTGGFDSRVIAYMLHSNQVDFHCFTSRNIGGENDAAFSVSQFLSVPHSFIPYWLEDGVAPNETVFWESSSTSVLFTNHTMNLAQYGPWPVQGFITGHYGDPVTGRQANLVDFYIAKKGREVLNRHFTAKQVVWDTGDICRLLRPEYKKLANTGYDSLMRICEEIKASNVFGLITRVDAEQRQRRYILKDYHCLHKLGVSVLPFNDYQLWDYFQTVPFEWQLGSVAYAGSLYDHLFKGEYEGLREIPINGIRRRSVSHPMLENWYLSLRDINKRVINRIKRKMKIQRDIAPARLSVFAEKELVKLFPVLETIYDIGELENLIKTKRNDYYFTVHNFWALYTIGRIIARLNNYDYNWDI